MEVREKGRRGRGQVALDPLGQERRLKGIRSAGDQNEQIEKRQRRCDVTRPHPGYARRIRQGADQVNDESQTADDGEVGIHGCLGAQIEGDDEGRGASNARSGFIGTSFFAEKLVAPSRGKIRGERHVDGKRDQHHARADVEPGGIE